MSQGDNLKVEQVFPLQLSLVDIKSIIRAVEMDPKTLDSVEVQNRAQEGKAQILRVSGDGMSGIIVTEVLQNQSGRELNVWLMAGEGFRFASKLLVEELEKFAKSNGCNRLRVEVKNTTLEKLYSRKLGFVKEAVVLVKEV